MRGWKTQALGTLTAGVRTGTTPPTSRPDYFDGQIQWFTPADIGNSKQLFHASRRITTKAISEGKAKLFPKGSLLITCIGQIGRVGILSQESSSNQQITAIVFTNAVEINFAYYWFVANRTRLENSANQALVPILNNERLLEIEMSYPTDIGEQQRIARLLDQVDWLRRARRYALELSDTFLPAAFLELFGSLMETAQPYEQVALDEVVETTQLGLVRGAKEMHPEFPYDYLRMDAIIGDGKLNLDGLKRVKATSEEVRDFNLQPGDFLFNTRNSRELVGKTALFQERRGICLFNNNIMRIRFKDSVTPEFMMGLFQTPWLKVNLESIKSGTTSVFAIYYKDLADLPIVVPPLPLQQKFTSLVDRHARLRAGQREALRQADHLFQTLLHQAFAAT